MIFQDNPDPAVLSMGLETQVNQIFNLTKTDFDA